MEFIEIKKGKELRDYRKRGKVDGKGSLHAILGWSSDGEAVEQSQKGDQIVQRIFYRDGHIGVGYFQVTRVDGKIVSIQKLGEEEFWPDTDHDTSAHDTDGGDA